MTPLAYVDTSILVATLWPEVHSAWAREVLDGRQLVSSALVDVELSRLAHRVGISQARVDAVVRQVSLSQLDSGVLSVAKSITGQVKALDAIHAATWLQLQSAGAASEFFTTDRKLAAAAASVGARVIHPF